MVPADTPAPSAKAKKKPRRVNVRTPEVMERVQAEVQSHYRSSVVEKLREGGGKLTVGNTTVRLAKQFGFCYGVERAIDLAYAARRVFGDRNIYLIGEIIHNPEVNRQLREMGIQNLVGDPPDARIGELGPDDVVIVPAFGADVALMDRLDQQGCSIVDTTCGDVMKVWRRVRQYARDGFTSIIHGKAKHEETRATASRALGDDGDGQYLVVLTLDDCDYLCRYIAGGEGRDREAFLARFEGAYSPGFDPDRHLEKVGVANQTTMLKGETEEIQRRVRAAVIDRDGDAGNFQVFDTICGATQERQDALFEMLRDPPDLLLVVGGYNSSNTSHLVEIAEPKVPTFFIRGASCITSLEEIVHYDLHAENEITSDYARLFADDQPVTIGITAGASCPNNLIEETVFRVFELRGVPREELEKLRNP